MHHKLDTDTHVYFYEQDFYALSNFSAFRLHWADIDFDTSEHAYQWEKFNYGTFVRAIQGEIRKARSAHEAFRLGRQYATFVRRDWPEIKVGVMRAILRAKADQHEYVRRKLLETGGRYLVEDSWRDAFSGWGPNKDGENMLGKLWMEIRQELRGQEA